MLVDHSLYFDILNVSYFVLVWAVWIKRFCQNFGPHFYTVSLFSVWLDFKRKELKKSQLHEICRLLPYSVIFDFLAPFKKRAGALLITTRKETPICNFFKIVIVSFLLFYHKTVTCLSLNVSLEFFTNQKVWFPWTCIILVSGKRTFREMVPTTFNLTFIPKLETFLC